MLASTDLVAFDRPVSKGRAMTAYDDQNVFAKILRGEIPCFKVHENERAFAFLDIMPRSPGHTLVIPKAPARGILDIAEDDLAEIARSAKRIAIAAMKAFDADGIIIQQFSEPASGQVVSDAYPGVQRRTARRRRCSQAGYNHSRKGKMTFCTRDGCG